MAAPGVREAVTVRKQAPVPYENMTREEPLPVKAAINKGENLGKTETDNSETAADSPTSNTDIDKEESVPDSVIIDLPDSNSDISGENCIVNLNGKSPDIEIINTPDTTNSDSNMTHDSLVQNDKTALPRIPEILSNVENETRIISSQNGTVVELQPKPPYKGVMVPCGQLKNYLDSLTTFNRKCMLRKGREVHKIYVELSKGETFLDDQFSYTEFGKMVLTNGSIRAGRAKNAKQIVVARETLYCSGTTSCKRACGGFGVCLPGCDKTKMRGHRCSYRIKLTQRLGFVNYWFVEELGNHGQYGKDKSEPPETEKQVVSAKSPGKSASTKSKREIRPSNPHSTSKKFGSEGSPSDKYSVNNNEISSKYHYILGLMPTVSSSQEAVSSASGSQANTQPENFSSQPQVIDMCSADLNAQAALNVAMATNTVSSQLSSMMPTLPVSIVSYLPPEVQGMSLEMLQSQDAAINPLLVSIKQEAQENGQSPSPYLGMSATGAIPFSTSQISKSHSPSPSIGQGSKERSPVDQNKNINLGIQKAMDLEMKIKNETSLKMQAHHETLGQVHNRIMERARMRKSSQTVRVPQKNSPLETESSQLSVSNLNIPKPFSTQVDSTGNGQHVSEDVLHRFQTLNHILQSKAFQEAKSQLESKKNKLQAVDQQQETALNLTMKHENQDTMEERNQSPYYKLAEEWKTGDQQKEPKHLTNGVQEHIAMATDTQELTDNEKELMCRVRQLESHVKQLQNIVIKREGTDDQATGNRRKRAQRDFDFSKYNTRHVALKILYLGFDYQGFASQEETDKTIEHVLFEALKKTRLIESRETSCYHRCGRTDRGVSAFSQVISLDLRSNLVSGLGVKEREGGSAEQRPGNKTTEIRYCYILNKVLPPEIRALAWAPVDPNFSARFSCTKRTYKYIFPKGNIDVKAMDEGAKKLIGQHDFRNLCKMDVANGVTNFVRRIVSADVITLDETDNGYTMCELKIVGSSFLWHQIRCIVTVLCLVGQGKEKPEVIQELLDVKKNPRKPQYTMASELPLCLYESEFGDDFDWIYEADWHEDNIKTLQQLWAQHAVKASMMKSMLDDMDKAKVETECDIAPWSDLSPPVFGQSDWILAGGNKCRVYRPLMERQTCDSLEDRIDHYVKKRKLDVGETGESAEAAGD